MRGLAGPWGRLLLFVLLLLGAIGFERVFERREIKAREQQRLQAQGRVIEEEIGRILASANRALLGLRDDFPDPQTVAARQTFRIKALVAVMPGVRTIFTLDAQGIVQTASRDDLVGQDLHQRAYFKRPKERLEAETLYLSEPFLTVFKVYTLTVSRELNRRNGEFAGVVVAGLDPDHLAATLRTLQYAPDLQIVLFHGSGSRFLQVPAYGEPRPPGHSSLTHVRSVRPGGVPLDAPLLIQLSRDPDVAYAPWRRQTAWMLAFWALFSGAGALLLRLTQQRQQALDTQAAAYLAALSQSEESLSITLASIGDGVVATDASGAVRRMNRTAERLIGMTLEQAQGRPLAEVFCIIDERSREPAADPVQQVLANGEMVAMANGTVLLSHDGQRYQIADSAAPIRNAAGGVVGVVLVFSDVSERYRSEQALRERERQLSLLADALPGPVARVDREGRYLFASAAYKTWFGLDPERLVGSTLAEVGPAEAYERVDAYQRRGRQGQRVSYEIEVPGPAQTVLHGLVTMVPYRDEDGELQGHFTIVADISEIRRAEAALRESEERWRAVIDNLNEGLVLCDEKARIFYWNTAARHMHGFTTDEDCRRALLDFDTIFQLSDCDGTELPVEQWPLQRLQNDDAVQGLLLQIRRTDIAWQRIFRYNGATVLDASGRRVAFLSIADITDAKRAEDALARNLAQMERTGALARVGGWELDRATGVLELSSEVRQLMEIGPALQLTCHEAHERFYPAEARAELQAAQERAMAQGGSWDLSSAFVTATGRQLWVRSRGQAALRGGQVVGLNGAIQDVTDLHQSRQQLEQSAALLRMASQAARMGAWSVDAATLRVHFSDELCALLDLPPGTAPSLEDCLAMYPLGPRETISALVRECLEQGTPFDVELEIFTARQRRLQMRSAGMAVRDGSGRIVRIQGAFQDISERKKSEAERRDLEAQLRESQKMESVGTLAGGIAHDFNNVLGAILGNVALARDDVGPGHPALLSLAQIEAAGLRARAMVQQILAFSRRQPHELRLQPLLPVVQESLGLLRATLPARVRLHTRLQPTPLQIRADATQIQQVILNLCTNAWHAMHGSSGVIEVGLEHLVLEAAAVSRLGELPAGNYAHVWVGDTGTGIDPATLKRIFEPFFTTKPVGQGTGLGLSVVHGIVLSHQGGISVDSTPGKGTVFHLYFPALAVTEGGDPGLQPRSEPLRGSDQHVLYIDDDEVMLLMVERLLRRLNYRVTCHVDPRKALRDLEARPDAFDLVVTDFNMPEISGLEVAEAVQRLRPALPVVISSGYLSEELRSSAARLGVRSLLQKQNTHDELAEVVYRILVRPRLP